MLSRALVQILSQPAFRAKVEEHIDMPKSQLEGCVYFKKLEHRGSITRKVYEDSSSTRIRDEIQYIQCIETA